MTGLSFPAPVQDQPGQSVPGDGWYPEVLLSDIRDRVRLGDGVVTEERLVSAIEGALISAMRELDGWRAEREQAGATELGQVTARTVGGLNYAVSLWRRAIRFLAAAELVDLHRDVTATAEGMDRADDKAGMADEYRRLAWHAIADLRSIGGETVPRNRVSLV